MALEAFEKIPDEKKERILSVGIKEFAQKSYQDVSTASITKECAISKGILFHYFGSKKEFYYYCLKKAMECLVSKPAEMVEADNFYDIIFGTMEQKMAQCMLYQDEMHMVNMASRDASAEIAEGKEAIIQSYMTQVQTESAQTIRRALQTLDFKENVDLQKATEGLHMYINAVLNKYLLRYQKTPDVFFEESQSIREEMRAYLDIVLFGICK